MRVLGLDGKEYPWTISTQKRKGCSEGHLKARILLQELFPLDVVFEEVTLPGSKTAKNGLLFADFYIRSRDLIVEVQGQQHTEHIAFFHETKAQFFESMVRDRVKREWCELNGITLIELPVSETVDEWRSRIESR